MIDTNGAETEMVVATGAMPDNKEPFEK